MRNITRENITRDLKFMESVHLRSLFYYFKVCGVAPVNYNIQAIDSAKVNRWTFVRSYKSIAYNVLFISLITIFSYFNLRDNYYKYNHLGFDGSVFAVVDTSAICSTLCIIIIFCIRHRKLLVLFNKVNSTREIITDSNSEPSKLQLKIVILLFINVAAWTFLITTIFMYQYVIMISFSTPCICIFIRNALTLQYCISLKLIDDLFDILNKNLRDLEVSSINKIGINKKLSQMWEWYSMLYKLTQDMSAFYSFPMLLNILCEFLMTITIIYYISKPLIFGNSDLDALDYVNSVAFTLIHIHPIILLTTSVSSTVDKGRKTCEIISDYLKEIEDQIVKDKLLHFSIYLVHNNIEFAVYDFFSLDGSLLVSIAGSVSTYLVILLQFQPPSSVKNAIENASNSTAIS